MGTTRIQGCASQRRSPARRRTCAPGPKTLATCILACTLTASLGGCSDDGGRSESSAPDAGTLLASAADAAVACERDADCSDGLQCNGRERCIEGDCYLGSLPSCDDGIACTADGCSEARGGCYHVPPDVDGDGHLDASCMGDDGVALGDDCDDLDPLRYPGNLEACDAAHHDEDCDPETQGGEDADGDGFVDQQCCNPSSHATDAPLVCGSDCDDRRANVHPQASEACDHLDNDCDGRVDEGVGQQLHPDRDHDSRGDETADPVAGCPGDVGYADNDRDCDDDTPAVHRDQVELCDEIDNDCDGRVDESPSEAAWYLDADGDGFGDPHAPVVQACAPQPGRVLLASDCDDADPAVHPAAAERCDARDNDCNGLLDFRLGVNDTEDDDGDGLPDAECTGGIDCDDQNPLSGDGMPEICDSRDNDCDSAVDEGTPNTVWYQDGDRDRHGDLHGSAVALCAPLPAHTPYGGDCDDATATTHPEAPELCNGSDDDCDRRVDEGCVACGNAVLDPGEACDDGAANDDGTPDACRTDCQLPRCGDGVVDSGEACDGAPGCLDGCSYPSWLVACTPADLDLGSALGSPVASGTLTGDDFTLPASCFDGSPAAGEDVVLTWSAPVSMWYEITTFESTANTVLALYGEDTSAPPACGTPDTCNDDTSGLAVSGRLANVPAAGTEILVIDSYGGGDYALHIRPLPCCDFHTPGDMLGDCATPPGTAAELEAVVDCVCASQPECCATDRIQLWDANCVAAVSGCGLACP